MLVYTQLAELPIPIPVPANRIKSANIDLRNIQQHFRFIFITHAKENILEINTFLSIFAANINSHGFIILVKQRYIDEVNG